MTIFKPQSRLALLGPSIAASGIVISVIGCGPGFKAQFENLNNEQSSSSTSSGASPGGAPLNGPPIAAPPTNSQGNFQVGELQFKHACTQPAARGKASGEIRRLTGNELKATYADLFGTAVMTSQNVKNALDLITKDHRSNNGRTSLVPQTDFANAAVELAYAVAETISNDQASLQNLFGQCFNGFPINSNCLDIFLQNFGPQILRRPLTSDEMTRFRGVLTSNMPTARDAFTVGLALMLNQPQFLFHYEGCQAATAGRVRLAPFEVASRISYAVTGSMPDQLLRQAAAADKLKTIPELRGQVERLLQTEKGKSTALELFDVYTDLDHIVAPDKEVIVRENSEGGNLDVIGKNQARILTAALQCQYTRVVSLTYIVPYDAVHIAHHTGCYDRAGNPDGDGIKHSDEKLKCSRRAADFVKMLNEVDVDGKKLLDNTFVLYASENGGIWEPSHDLTSIPVIYFGGGDEFVHGEYVDFRVDPVNGKPRNRVPLCPPEWFAAGHAYNHLPISILNWFGLDSKRYQRKDLRGNVNAGFGKYFENDPHYAVSTRNKTAPLPHVYKGKALG